MDSLYLAASSSDKWFWIMPDSGVHMTFRFTQVVSSRQSQTAGNAILATERSVREQELRWWSHSFITFIKLLGDTSGH